MSHYSYNDEQLTMLGMGFLWGSNPTDLILAEFNPHGQHDGSRSSCLQIQYPGHGSVIMDALNKLADNGNAEMEVIFDRGVIFIYNTSKRSYFRLGLYRKMVIWMENVFGIMAQAFIEGFDTAVSMNNDGNMYPLTLGQQSIVNRIRSRISSQGDGDSENEE